MELLRIASTSDPALRDYVALTDVALRRTTEPARGLYIAESHTVLERALAAGHTPRSVLVSERWLPAITALLGDRDVPVYLGTEEQLESITGFHLHRGALAAMQRPVLPRLKTLLTEAKTIVVLDGLVDHTNVGAAFRSVAGLGADAVLVTERTADPLYRRSVRVSMGTVLQVPWTRIPSLDEARGELRDAGFEIAALALHSDAIELATFAAHRPERVALVFGTEGHGLDAKAIAASDTVVRIDMHHGVDSLNVAASTAVALWALMARA